MTQTCKCCGQQFKGRNSRSKYCSCSCANSSTYEDLSGKRFNHLLVLSRNPDKSWRVKCDCGNTKSMQAQVIKKAKSCTAFCCVPRVDPNVAKRRWALANKERVRKQHDEFLARNPGVHRVYNKRYVNKHPDRVKAKRKRYNALPETKEYYRQRSTKERESLSDHYVLTSLLGIRSCDVPPEVLPAIVKLKRTQVQARRLCRQNNK